MHTATEKRCSRCGATKPTTEFHKRKSGSSDGLMSACKECNKAKIYAWREKNKEKYKEYRRQRNALPSEQARRAEYYQRPEVKRRTLERERREEVRAMRKKWREENKDKIRHYYIDKNHKRRAKTKGGLSKKQWIEICSKYRNRCVYCGKKAKLTVDHVIALSTGGAHDPSNIVPACLPCNASKRAMHPVDFAQERLGRLL